MYISSTDISDWEHQAIPLVSRRLFLWIFLTDIALMWSFHSRDVKMVLIRLCLWSRFSALVWLSVVRMEN